MPPRHVPTSLPFTLYAADHDATSTPDGGAVDAAPDPSRPAHDASGMSRFAVQACPSLHAP